jgi:hypothetical protein
MFQDSHVSSKMEVIDVTLQPIVHIEGMIYNHDVPHGPTWLKFAGV